MSDTPDSPPKSKVDVEPPNKELYLLDARVGSSPIWDKAGNEVSSDELPLSDRLCIAIDDWREFFDATVGNLSDPDMADEFVSQGFKIAFRMRSELKGRVVTYRHPIDGQIIEVDPKKR